MEEVHPGGGGEGTALQLVSGSDCSERQFNSWKDQPSLGNVVDQQLLIIRKDLTSERAI